MTSSLKRFVKSSPILVRLAVPVFRAQSVALSHLPLKGEIPRFEGRSRLHSLPFESKQDYDAFLSGNEAMLTAEQEADASAVPADAFAFGLEGHCSICDMPTVFVTSMEYADEAEDGRIQPNWRENLICKGCGLRSRVRAALQIAIQDMGLKKSDALYITEQFGPTYRWLKGRFDNVTGSEYIRPGSPSGSRHAGINHQDVQALSFADASFDFLMSFDVLEHVPDNDAAFSEIARVLKPGGKLLLTIPFTADREEMTVRAEMGRDGGIVHHLPIEMHGNPTDPLNGALCFRHYGWDTLAHLRRLGFRDLLVRRYHDARLGHRGQHQLLITAIKA